MNQGFFYTALLIGELQKIHTIVKLPIAQHAHPNTRLETVQYLFLMPPYLFLLQAYLASALALADASIGTNFAVISQIVRSPPFRSLASFIVSLSFSFSL